MSVFCPSLTGSVLLGIPDRPYLYVAAYSAMDIPSGWLINTLTMQTLSGDRAMDQDASLIFARAGPPAVRFMHDWISVHKRDIRRLGNATRHAQVSPSKCSPSHSGPLCMP